MPSLDRGIPTRLCLLALAPMVLCLGLPKAAVAQIEVERLEPPAVGVGVEATLQAQGKFPVWPVEVVCDRADVHLKPTETSGQWVCTVDTGAAPGVAWVRMHDPSSASQLVPLLIEPVAPTVETEPNNELDQANPLQLPAVLSGRLEKAGEVDTYRIHVAQDQTLVVAAVAHQLLRSPMDAVLQLVDERGNVLLQSDDQRGLDPQLVWTADKDADLRVRVFAFPETPTSTVGYAGGASFAYVLRATTETYVDHALPLVAPANAPGRVSVHGWNFAEKQDVHRGDATLISPVVVYVPSALGWQWQGRAPDEAMEIDESPSGEAAEATSLPCVFSGHISQPAEVDRLRFPVEKGTKYCAVVQSHDWGLLLDSVVRVVDTRDGSELARNDDAAKKRFDARAEFASKADGTCELQVSDLVDGFGPRHAYSVVVTEVVPSIALSLAGDRFTIQPGASVEVPVTIARRDGFDREVSVSARSLPPGVHCDPVVSSAKGESSKSVTLKLTAVSDAPPHQGSFQIIAGPVTAGEATAVPDASVVEPSQVLGTATYALRDELPVEQIWLTVAAAAD